MSSKFDSFIETSTASCSIRKEKLNSSSKTTTHPYGLSENEAGPFKGAVTSKKRKQSTARNNSTQSKKLKPQEDEVPYLSLPEEDEMDRNVQELFREDSRTGSESEFDSDDDNCDEIFTELSKEINNEEDKGPAIEENLKTCINAIWQKPLKKEK